MFSLKDFNWESSRIWKCTKCHHEWKGIYQRKCDWCGEASEDIGAAYGKKDDQKVQGL